MPKYSFKSKKNKEFIKTLKASSLEEATFIFSKVKNLTKKNFLRIYEVVER